MIEDQKDEQSKLAALFIGGTRLHYNFSHAVAQHSIPGSSL
jgi:hypothetical protein